MNTDTHGTGPDPIRDPEPPATPAASAASAPKRRPRPRTGPIVWGALILALCGYVAQRTFDPSQLDTTIWLTSTVIGLGLLLLGVGTVVLIRNSRR